MHKYRQYLRKSVHETRIEHPGFLSYMIWCVWNSFIEENGYVLKNVSLNKYWMESLKKYTVMDINMYCDLWDCIQRTQGNFLKYWKHLYWQKYSYYSVNPVGTVVCESATTSNSACFPYICTHFAFLLHFCCIL